MSSELMASLLAGAAAVVLVMGSAALVARRQGRVVVVDTAWGLGFVVVALVCAVVSVFTGTGDPSRTWLVAVMVGVWGSRLALHVGVRSRREGEEDPRYLAVLGGPLSEVGMGVAIRKVFAVQGVAMAIIALPIALGAATEVRWWPVAIVGGLVWLIGLFFETVGDAQLARYRSQPREERPAVLDTGLWRYTRHPNYFGDFCVWWGIWLAAAAATGGLIGVITIVSPIAMSFFLVAVTGVKLTERTMMKRPAYRDYAARTSMFVPLPPRRR